MQKFLVALLASCIAVSLPAQSPTDTVLTLTSTEYTSLVSFIEERGTKLGTDYNNGSHYVYWDALGNRHAMITIRSRKDTHRKNMPFQISVWVNGRGAKPGKHFFFYLIRSPGTVEYDSYLNLPTKKTDKQDTHDAVQALVKSVMKKRNPCKPVSTAECS